jgi:hypothetical protein
MSRKITYFAVQALQVGDEIRQPGDLIPEANGWTHADMEVRIGRLQPVLVSTLSKDDQDYLALFWEEQDKAAAAAASAAAKATAKKATAKDDEPKIVTDNRLPRYTPLEGMESDTPDTDERKSA